MITTLTQKPKEAGGGGAGAISTTIAAPAIAEENTSSMVAHINTAMVDWDKAGAPGADPCAA